MSALVGATNRTSSTRSQLSDFGSPCVDVFFLLYVQMITIVYVQSSSALLAPTHMRCCGMLETDRKSVGNVVAVCWLILEIIDATH